MTKMPYGFKKKIIRDLLERDPKRNDYELASFVGCHRTYVGYQRRALFGESNYNDTATTVSDYDEPLVLSSDMVYHASVSDTLNERHKTYGIFEDLSKVAVDIKAAVRDGLKTSGGKLASDQQEAIDMIATKIARIVNGTPDKTDHWTDIAGYATLVADRLEGRLR